MSNWNPFNWFKNRNNKETEPEVPEAKLPTESADDNEGRAKWKDNVMKALDLASDWKGQSKSSPGGNEKDGDVYKQPGMGGGGFSDLGGGNTVQQGFINQPFTLTTPGKRSTFGRIAGTAIGFVAGGPVGAYKGYQMGNQFDA